MTEVLNVKVDRIYKTDTDSKIKAFVDLIFGDLFLVKGFRVVEGEKGLFVDMPKSTNKTEQECKECGSIVKSYNTFVPVTQEIREYLKEVILDAYKED